MSESKEITLNNFAEVKEISKVLYASGLFTDLKSEAQATVKVLAGQELGLRPFASVQGIDIIQGRVSIKPLVIGARIKQSGKYNFKVVKSDIHECKIEFTENGEVQGSYSFNIEDANRASLAGKDNWKKYPQDMLFHRTLAGGARRFCPDLFMFPIYVDGEIYEAEPQEEIKDNISKVQQSIQQSKVDKAETIKPIEAKTEPIPLTVNQETGEVKEPYDQIVGAETEPVKQEIVKQKVVKVDLKKNGAKKKSARPYLPSEIKAKFLVYANEKHIPIPGFSITYWIRIITMRLVELLKDMDAVTSLMAFFNPNSLKDWTEGEIVALKLWLNLPDKEEDTWQQTSEIKQEIEAILKTLNITPKEENGKPQNKFF